jgi:hypothetical protein
MSLKIVQESLREHKPTLLEKKNVVCVSSGFKIKNGVKTDIPSFIISVKSKLNLSQLSVEDVIPSEINGIKTDVIEVGEIHALGTCVVAPSAACPPHGNLYDPLIGGISIGVKKFDRTNAVYYTASGTLGSICVDLTDGSLVVLTNNHVAGVTHKNGYPMMTENISGYDFDSFTEALALGVPLAQPSYVDYGNVWNPMFSIKRVEGFKTSNDINDPQLIDAAVLSINSIDKSDCKVLELLDDLNNAVDAGPFPWASPSEVTVGMPLFKSGRTTGMVNFGTITSIDSTPVVSISSYLITYDEQLMISYASLCAFSGDSGSGVYARIGGRIKLVGLLHAGNTPAGTVYYVCPIWKVADILNLKAWNGDIILPASYGNSIVKNGKNYNKLGNTLVPPTHLLNDNSSSSSKSDSSSSSPSSNSSDSFNSNQSDSSNSDSTDSPSDSSSSSNDARGIFAGGAGSGGARNVIDYITITTASGSTDFGDLTGLRYFISACSSSTRGIFGGGVNGPGTKLDTIDYVTIATTGNAINFGVLSVIREALSACSSSTRGIFGGGLANPSLYVNTIDYVTIATIGNANDFGDLVAQVAQEAAFSSPTRGIFAGGSVSSTISYVTIATTGNSSNFGNLTAAKTNLAGCSNSVTGLVGGYFDNSAVVGNNIDYITIATLGDAADFGDLTVARAGLGGCSSSIRGVFGGGFNAASTYVSTVDYVTIASFGNATNFGGLTISRMYLSACSSVHGGL